MNHVFSISRGRTIDSSNLSDAEVNPPLLVAPNVSQSGTGIASSNYAQTGTTVDVVSDFYWTYSKLAQARQEVPKIILTERRLKANALISQLKYSFGATKETVTAAINKLPDDVKNDINDFFKTIEESTGIGQKTAEFTNKFDFLQDNNDIYDKNPYLRPYRNLYITEPTGWQFIMPYFENFSGMQSNAFSDDAPNPFLGILKKAADGLTDLASTAAILRGPAAISFVEKSKFYSYNTDGEELSFTLPLINTGSVSFDDVIRNWELLFLLLYNNKPARRNTALIDPPNIYQVEIPGVKFLPFCYISSIAIEFQGSRRELTFDLSYIDNLNIESALPTFQGGVGNAVGGLIRNFLNNKVTETIGFFNQPIRKKITTIIPDAYVIKITLKSLIADSKNFMYSILNNTPIVTTSVSDQTAAESVIQAREQLIINQSLGR